MAVEIVKTKWGPWNGYQLKALKDGYAAARRDSKRAFMIGDQEVVTDFAKHMIAFLEGEGLRPRDDDLAFSFKEGCVAPDGSIWLTPQARIATGVVQITEEEAAKAKLFGWTETGTRTPGYVHLHRVRPV